MRLKRTFFWLVVLIAIFVACCVVMFSFGDRMNSPIVAYPFLAVWAVTAIALPIVSIWTIRRALPSRSPSRRSELLSTAFERVNGQWIWYSNAGSKGIVVSQEERDLYLAFRPVAFRQAIWDRQPTEPRRPYWPTLKRLLTATISGRDPADLSN